MPLQENRDSNFKRIEDAYHKFFYELLDKGKFPWRSTKKGFWGCSIMAEVYELFKKIELEKYSSFLDLGSGDGRVVLIASLFTKAYGIEADEELVGISEGFKEKLGIKNAFFKRGDFLKQNIVRYDVLYHFPDKPMKEVEDKLVKEMRGIFILYGPHFLPMRLKQKRLIYLGMNSASIYTPPK